MILVWIFRFVVILLGWHVDFWCLFDLGDLLAVILLGMGLLEVEADAKG